MIRTALIGAMLTLAWLGPVAAADRPRLLMLDPQFDSSAADGQTPALEAADRARLDAVAGRFKARLAAAPDYALIDDPAAAAEIDTYTLGACGRCELMIARKAKADLVMVTSVQKMSSMLINLSAAIYDVSDGSVLVAGTAVIHADSDADWNHAADKLAERQLKLPAP